MGKGGGMVRGGYRNFVWRGGLFYFRGVKTTTDTFLRDLRPLCTPLGVSTPPVYAPRGIVAQLSIIVNPGP